MGSGGYISVPGLETIRGGGGEAALDKGSGFDNRPSEHDPSSLRHARPASARPKALPIWDEFPLRSTDGVAENLYMYLWAKNSQGCSCPGVRLPQTVVYRDRSPVAWVFFSKKERTIMRKKPQNMNGAAIAEAFAKGSSKDGSAAAGGVVWMPGFGEDPAYQASQGAAMLHLEPPAMRQWVLSAQKPLAGVLQKHVEARDGRNSVVRADWTPQVCVLERRTNRHPIASEKLELPQRLATFDGADHLSESNPIAGSVLPALVREVCNNIVEHVLDVSQGRHQVVRMVLDFKVDASQHLNLLYCSSLRLLGDAPDPVGLGRVPSTSPYLARMTTTDHLDWSHKPPAPPDQGGARRYRAHSRRASVSSSWSLEPLPTAAPARTLSAGSMGRRDPRFICAQDGELHDALERQEVTYKMLLLMADRTGQAGHPDAIPAAIQRADPILSLEKFKRTRGTHGFLYSKAAVCRSCAAALTKVAKEHIALHDAEEEAVRARGAAQRQHSIRAAADAGRPPSGRPTGWAPPGGGGGGEPAESAFGRGASTLPDDFPSALLPKQGHVVHRGDSAFPPRRVSAEDSRDHSQYSAMAAAPESLSDSWCEDRDSDREAGELEEQQEEEQEEEEEEDLPEDPVLRVIRKRVASAGGSAEVAMSSWLAKGAPREGQGGFCPVPLSETMAHAAALLGVGPDGTDLPPRPASTAAPKPSKPRAARRAASAAPKGRAHRRSRELKGSAAVRRNAVSEDGSPEDVLAAAGIRETDGDEWDDDDDEVVVVGAVGAGGARPRIGSAARQQDRRSSARRNSESAAGAPRAHQQQRPEKGPGGRQPAPFEVRPVIAGGTRPSQKQDLREPDNGMETHSNRIGQMRAIYMPAPHAKGSKARPPCNGKSKPQTPWENEEKASSKQGRAPEPRKAPVPTIKAVATAPLGARLTAEERRLLGEVIASPRDSVSISADS